MNKANNSSPIQITISKDIINWYKGDLSDNMILIRLSLILLILHQNLSLIPLCYFAMNHQDAQRIKKKIKVNKILFKKNLLKIANISLPDFPLFLAPMEDITDPSFRMVCKNEWG